MRKRILTVILIPLLLFYAIPAEAAEKEGRKWQDETVYYVMIDRFNNGDMKNDKDVDVSDPEAFQGGDFQGIIEKLDYLKDMGFTTIALSPIFKNEARGYHGYWINDLYKTDEHFGDEKLLQKLVKEAHKRNMKVIVDFVVNHVGPHHPWVNDPAKKDWLHPKTELKDATNQEELETSWIEGLPDLAQENPEVKSYLIGAGKFFIEQADIDGYIVNQANYVSKGFLKSFTSELRKVKPDLYLIGDVESDNPKMISSYESIGFDGLFNYPLVSPLRTAYATTDRSLSEALSISEKNTALFNESGQLINSMDNLNMPRFTKDAEKQNQHPGTRWKLALTYLYTNPGAPFMYYGSEIALNGGNTPDNRKFMDFKTDKDLIDYLKKIGELRQKLPALTRGSYKLLYEKNGMIVFKREYNNETAVVAINNTSKTQKVVLTDQQLAKDKELRGLLKDDLVRSDNGEYKLVLNRETSEVYVLSNKTGLNIPYLTAMVGVYVAFILFIYFIWKRSRKK